MSPLNLDDVLGYLKGQSHSLCLITDCGKVTDSLERWLEARFAELRIREQVITLSQPDKDNHDL